MAFWPCLATRPFSNDSKLEPAHMDTTKERLTCTPPRFKLSRLSKELYVSFLHKAQAQGFSFCRFRELDGADRRRCIVIRHDIDLSPKYALLMATIEHELRIATTYFVMLDGQFYNALEPENVKAIRAIQELGHEVGLHFSAKSSIEGDIDRDIQFQMGILEAIIEAPVFSFSQHDPVNAGSVEPGSGRYVDAYGAIPKYDLLYVSDSGMMWREHTFEAALGANRSLCLLAHPISWLHEKDDLIAIIREVEDDERRRAAQRFDTFADNHIKYYERRLSEGV